MTDRLIRVQVTGIDDILGVPFEVLDSGFVRVIDYMGSDDAIVQAARISYGTGTKHVSEDRSLIRYLMRHRHTTPFEMCEIKLHIRVPMDCWRQWIRHRTANVNEYSTRYSEAIDVAQRTGVSGWRQQSTSNRQGSSGTIDIATGAILSRDETELQAHARQVYEARLRSNVAREQARKDLPLSTYTEAYWKIDLHNLFHFLELRMSEQSQAEIRQYANIIGLEIVSKWCPMAWEAFVDYRLGAHSFSKTEFAILREIVQDNDEAAIRMAGECGWTTGGLGEPKRSRERDEFEKKLQDLGLSAPWRSRPNEGEPPPN